MPFDSNINQINSTLRHSNVPVPQDFSVCAIRIDDNCAHRKRLNAGLYFFNDLLIEDKEGQIVINPNSALPKKFFGSNITVHAIVGQNGSGKSSILELMYRAINNFSFMLELGMHKNSSADNLCYVKGIYLTLYYLLDGKIGTLQACGDTMYFAYGDVHHNLSFTVINNLGVRRVIFDNLDIKNEVVAEATVTAPVARMAEVARCFFYTIVTNYSMQSYIDNDYAEEKTYVEYKQDLTEGKGGKKQISRNVIEREGGDVWIRSVFHKNDGYRTPIVLNPFRSEGTIDLNKEFRLTQYRLSAIFIRAKQMGIHVLDNYELDNVEYRYDPLAVERKFEKQFGKTVHHSQEWFRLQDMSNVLRAENSIAYIILKDLELLEEDFSNPILRDACLYMIYKVLSIGAKYPSYYEFEDFGKITSYFQEVDNNLSEVRLQELIERINKDTSHITIKFRQMKNFISILSTRNVCGDTWRFLTYSGYIQELKGLNLIEKEPTNLRELTITLPPAIYDIDIILKQGEKSVSIQRMSSGERQFLYNCSTFVYHIMNLKSVQDNRRVRYRCMNLVLDEVEICFHPEYQRRFVNELINLIVRLKLNFRCSINIMIATHSPFILSDIPQSNILYLEDGHCVNEEVSINPFAANVNDILHQSFFLKNSFMGDFALGKVEELVNYIDRIRTIQDEMSENDLLKRINLIGDGYLRQQLITYMSYKVNLMRYGKTTDR